MIIRLVLKREVASGAVICLSSLLKKNALNSCQAVGFFFKGERFACSGLYFPFRLYNEVHLDGSNLLSRHHVDKGKRAIEAVLLTAQ